MAKGKRKHSDIKTVEGKAGGKEGNEMEEQMEKVSRLAGWLACRFSTMLNDISLARAEVSSISAKAEWQGKAKTILLPHLRQFVRQSSHSLSLMHYPQ